MPYLIGKDWSLSISEDGNTMIDVGRVSGLQLSRSYGSNEITTTSNDGEKNYELSDESRTISLSCVRDDEDDGQEILLSYAEGRSPLFYDLRSSSTGERYIGRFIVSDYSITVSSSEASQVEFSLRCISFDLGDPILDVDFAGTESLIDQSSQSNLITFSRSTVATYVGFDGLIKTASIGEPRIERDPISREPQGILIEQQRTNYVTFSNGLSGFSLNQTTLTTGATSAPDGTSTASKIVATATDNAHYAFYGATGLASGSVVSWSCFVKYAGDRYAVIHAHDIPPAAFDLLTGEFEYVSPQITATQAVAFTNGWYRLTITYTSSLSIPYAQVYIGGSPVTGYSYTGNDVDGIYVWGAQIEAAASPTSYIPTEASEITRSRDDARIEGANFRSVLQLGNNSADVGSLAARNLKEATIVCSLKKIDRPYYSAAAQIMFAMSDNGGNASGNRLDIRIQYGRIRTVFILADYGEERISDHSISDGEDAVVAVSFDASGFTSVVNNGPFVDQSFTSWPLPLFNILQIGNGDGFGDPLAIPLRSVKVYDRRMTKAEMRHLCGVG